MSTVLPEHMSDYQKRKALVDVVCTLTTDRQSLAIAKWWAMYPNGRAAAHLNYYLDGTGVDKTVDLNALLREDSGVSGKLRREITAAIRNGKTSGTVAIPQQTYVLNDWLLALGGINVEWQATAPTAGPSYGSAMIKLSFRNKYQWHPYEARFTQSLHSAAVRLKKKGAQDYWMKGEATMPLQQI
jgi:hypothetical protein